ncbi:MAG: adenylate/guanylate cyclase domain-containing protein [Spirochaetes bacterium]|nr:adenylate/guanylate cyclase domain-containing protein [Spirochaetota bacterium]
MDTNRVTIADWLLSEGPRLGGVAAFLVGFIRQLNAAGFEIMRATLMVRTLHPEIESIRFGWTSEHVEMPPLGRPFFLKQRHTPVDGDVVEEISFSHGAFARSAPYQISPYKKLDLGATEVYAPVRDGAQDFPIVEDIQKAGGTAYFLTALPQLGEAAHRISFATKKRGGFSEQDLHFLRSLAAPLAAAVEIQLNRLITENLMAVYLGLLPAQKVLAGKVKPGDVDAITSAIWFSDLRGYTDLSAKVDPPVLVEWLNRYFETISAPIVENGGEVLKYMGDAVLAIFPVENGGRAKAAHAALAAADAADKALAIFNTERAEAKLPLMRHGIALHIGDVQYGNIGANRRLDFTVIGPAVNKAARIESLCKETGRALLFSADFAAFVAGAQRVGEFKLKGIEEPETVFARD